MLANGCKFAFLVLQTYETSLLFYFWYLLTSSTVPYSNSAEPDQWTDPSDLGLHCLKKSSVYYEQVYSIERIN